MERKTRWNKALFYLILIVTILPIILLPLYDIFYCDLYQLPTIKEGVLDLKGYQLEKNIPLKGEWEFYWNQWIITEQLQEREPDFLIEVPSSWAQYEINGQELSQQGHASYRLQLKNCPQGLELTSYVPNIGTEYKVFLNGQLIADNGYLANSPASKWGSSALIRERLNFVTHRDSEIVIEVSENRMIGGLYMTPILAENSKDLIRTQLRSGLSSIYTGIYITLIGLYGYNLLQKNKVFYSISLMILDLILLLRILSADDFFNMIELIFPFLQYDIVNIIVQLLTYFLPTIMLVCIDDLIERSSDKKLLQGTIFYACVCCIFAIYSFIVSSQEALYVISLIAYAPFLLIVKRFHGYMKMNLRLTCYVFTEVMLLISGLLISNHVLAGILSARFSMYPTICFVIAILLQAFIYIKKNTKMTEDALEAANLRVKLKESEMTLLLSQIKPHFLYNALLAIQVLCTREPETAQAAIDQFAKYLRANMQSINCQKPITFQKELEHIENYVSIEKLRFKERLHVMYELQTTDFSVPPLTIQPLVENAIKHGVCKNIMGGTVTIKSYKNAAGYCVEIIDDGPGFDIDVLENKVDSIGIKNISLRLEHMMKARIAIQSQLDVGTTVRVTIPKGENDEDIDH